MCAWAHSRQSPHALRTHFVGLCANGRMVPARHRGGAARCTSRARAAARARLKPSLPTRRTTPIAPRGWSYGTVCEKMLEPRTRPGLEKFNLRCLISADVCSRGAKSAGCLNRYVVFSVFIRTSLPRGSQVRAMLESLRGIFGLDANEFAHRKTNPRDDFAVA